MRIMVLRQAEGLVNQLIHDIHFSESQARSTLIEVLDQMLEILPFEAYVHVLSLRQFLSANVKVTPENAASFGELLQRRVDALSEFALEKHRDLWTNFFDNMDIVVDEMTADLRPPSSDDITLTEIRRSTNEGGFDFQMLLDLLTKRGYKYEVTYTPGMAIVQLLHPFSSINIEYKDGRYRVFNSKDPTHPIAGEGKINDEIEAALAIG